jgi:uncharacterized membrane protein YkoI
MSRAKSHAALRTFSGSYPILVSVTNQEGDDMSVRTWAVAAVAAGLLLVGAGVAYATGSGEGSSVKAGAADIEKAKNVALEQVNGRVTGTEVGDEEGYYEVEVTRDDGSQVDVHLDKNFNVIDTPADHEGHENEDAADDDGDDGGE